MAYFHGTQESLRIAKRERLLRALDCANDYGLLRIFYKESTAKIIMKSLDEIVEIVKKAECDG